jgi:formylglycine-generating enzyme required for sulfatase activity
LDGTGRNGLFTSQLLRHIVTPGIEVKELFNRTGADVIRVSNSTQIPEVHNNFFGEAFLGSRPVTPDPPPFPPEPLPPRPLPPPTPANMVSINGGTFTMGSPVTEIGRNDNEGPQRQVTVSPFFMGKHQVTVGEFRRFVEETWYKTEAETGGGGFVWTGDIWQNKEDANWDNPHFNQNDNHPVVLVSWYDAIWYCNWLSVQEGLQPVYVINGRIVHFNQNANGYRLPTEAEWEFACRAGTITPFNTGGNILTSQANYNGNFPYSNAARGVYLQRTSPVGRFPPNSWGLYDMHGNVDEWCWDWEGRYGSNAQTDPVGSISGFTRIVRGGGWYDSGQYLRSASRGSIFPSGRNNRLGFRVVRSIVP